ncbi:hypothetical protein ACHAWF_017711 [Thalassiosira exigua]
MMKGELKELNRAIDAKLVACNDGGGGGAQLSVLSTADAPGALEVLSRAFLEDLMFAWVAGLDDDDPRREEKLYRLCRNLLGWANHRFMNRSRGVAVGLKADRSDLAGCFTVAPGSHAKERAIDILRCVFHHGLPPTHARKEKKDYCANAAKRLEALGPLVKKRGIHMKDATRWLYLQSIGVRPEHQGKGYGKRMLELLNDLSASMGASIYLETESEALESMYKRFGYRTLEEIDVSAPGDPSSLRMYLMRRDP